MSHTVFLAGSTADDMACFADAAKQAGNQVYTANTEKEQTGAAAWNKASPISARTALLQAVASFGEVDRAVLYFDAAAFDGVYDKFTVENISRGLDDMIAGFQYMTEEFVNRYAQKADQPGSWLTFIDCSSTSETGVLTTAAEAAFKAFAEKAAEKFAGSNLKITLVRCDDATITETADWLISYWELPSAEKAASQTKTATHWVKSGGKPPLGLLGL
ncbi:MAG: hypothetical protein KBT02_06195 [Treponema sp.]|nr:hypothetical protein [Candidatus Treponema caballi]